MRNRLGTISQLPRATLGRLEAQPGLLDLCGSSSTGEDGAQQGLARRCRAISSDLEVSITRSGRVVAVGKMLEWCLLLKAMF